MKIIIVNINNDNHYKYNNNHCMCRIIHDICFMFKLTHCLTDFNLHHAICYAPNVGTKGHRYKLYIAHARKLIPSTHFMHCIMPIWNFLPDQCFSPDTYNALRTKIRKLILAGS